ncbi:GNAT family N-acetyltransferase [Marichromatium bheemlicum]|uniref:N-acetyltransferase n=1 Tax=Marichromatium bheemlicum TaxID=365339 RepID=A0ABX1I448_9GAMM|nr:GNAT family N-acetyltransferase [Marichromatium bheemlicum]NKN31624.1 N-acetyltransferase [Marichromatium bheemlicum]
MHEASTPSFSLTTHGAITEIPAASWDRLVGDDAPFLRHAFLAALEQHGCVGEALGWIPLHLALHDTEGVLCAAAPCYIKTNGYGEFVFDWAWAEAHHRQGLPYYPKLVVAAPYTPAVAPRILTAAADTNRPRHARALIEGARHLTERLGLSSMHWLFHTEQEGAPLAAQGFLPRLGCQFHWHRHDEHDFDDLLAQFTSAKRKQIRRERRRVTEAGLRLARLRGDQLSATEWATLHHLYCDTFTRLGGVPTLSLEFFAALGESMGESLLVVFCYQGARIVAAAFNLVGARTLYGRHWGCRDTFHSLHFEACYYQGLEHCIATGLDHFQPGAQGEHKISRGFLPTATWSSHWVADPELGVTIARALEHETRGMRAHLRRMQAHSPYRRPTPSSLPSD